MGDMVSGWARRRRVEHLSLADRVETDLLASPRAAWADTLPPGLQLFQDDRSRGRTTSLRQARELGDLDAVAAVGPAGDDLAQEDELVAALFDGDVVVLHAREACPPAR